MLSLSRFLTTLLIGLALVSPLTTFGQPSMAQLNQTLTQVFAGHKEFTADADVQVTGPKQQLKSLPVAVQWQKGNGRFDIDLAQVKSAQLPPEQLAGLVKAGLSKLTAILDPSGTQIHLISPGMKSYASHPLPKEGEAGAKPVTIKKVELGKETIAGQACEKQKLILQSDGTTREILSWNSTALKGFPVQLKMLEGEDQITIQFRNVKLASPAATSFVLPQGLTRFNTVQDLMGAAMARLMMSPK